MKEMIKYSFLIVAMLIASGCAKDSFVDIQPPYSINSESYFNTEEDYQQALIGAYDLLQSTYLNVVLGEIASDNTLCGGENANDVTAWQEIDDMTHGVVNSELRNVWNWMYGGINRCNYIFEFRNKLDFDGKDNVLGQAAFLRAYYYFELVKFFGDVPMPIDQRVSFESSTSFDRTPVAEVYAQIESDLKFAAENLPLTQAEAGRVTKGAAQSLLGKVYLFQEKFSDAASVLDEVINSGVYDLYDDYSTLFLREGENNIESVFEVQYTNEQGAGFGCLQCSEGNVAVGFNGIRAYAGPIYADGFSFNVPVQELVDDFEAGDLRLDPTILDIEVFAAANNATYQEGYEHTGYFNHKYIPRQGENFQDPHLTNSTNYRAIRFSDVLLMAAEAYNRGGLGEVTALDYLNRVRARAGLDPVNSGGSALTEDIYHERRIELAGEGHRFFDLVRTGQAAEKIPGFQSGKHELFPIPLIEIELAGNRWTQNPGY